MNTMTGEDLMDLGAGVSKVKELATKHVDANAESVWKYRLGYAWCMPWVRYLIWISQSVLLIGSLRWDWPWMWLLVAGVVGAVISGCYYGFKTNRARLIAEIQRHMMVEFDVKIGGEWLEVMMVVKWKLLAKLPEYGSRISTKRWNNWLKAQ